MPQVVLKANARADKSSITEVKAATMAVARAAAHLLTIPITGTINRVYLRNIS